MRANERAARSAEAVAGAHADLRARASRRARMKPHWPASLLSAGQIIARIDAPPFRPANSTGYRRHGTARMPGLAGRLPRRQLAAAVEGQPALRTCPGAVAGPADAAGGRQPAGPSRRTTGTASRRACSCWSAPTSSARRWAGWSARHRTGSSRRWPPAATRTGYAALQDLIDADPDGITAGQARLALGRITMIMACKGGLVRDITVGDYLDLLDAMHQTGTGGAGRLLAYRLLHGLGHLGPDAPVTGRAFLQAAGQRTVEELVDRYQVQCRPVRDLLVDYLRERQPAVDYISLVQPRRGPGPAVLDGPGTPPPRDRLDQPGARDRRRLAAPHQLPAGDRGRARRRQAEALVPRAGARSTMMTVRAFYLDIAQWALEEPHRWAQWAVPCPVKETDCNRAKHDKLASPGWTSGPANACRSCPPWPARSASTAGQRGSAGSRPPGPARATSSPAAARPCRRLPAPTAYTGSIWAARSGGGPRADLTRQEERQRSGPGRPSRSCAIPASSPRVTRCGATLVSAFAQLRG